MVLQKLQTQLVLCVLTALKMVKIVIMKIIMHLNAIMHGLSLDTCSNTVARCVVTLILLHAKRLHFSLRLEI